MPMNLSAMPGDELSSGFDRVFEVLLDFFVRYGLIIGLSVAAIVLIIILVKVYFAVRAWQIKRLSYRRGFSLSGVFEGEHLILWEEITNNTALPLLFVDIEAYVFGELQLEGYTGLHEDDMQYFISRFHIPPKTTVRRSRKVYAKKRGVYKLSTVSVYVRKEAVYFDAPATVYVYPKYVNVDEYSEPVNMLQGDIITKRRLITDPFNVAGIRDLAPGDPFNLINFKATAKTGGRVIKVNEREFCSGRIFMICINFQLPGEYSIPGPRYEKIMEEALSFAASLVRKALNSGYKVGFAANCKSYTGDNVTSFLPSSGTGVLEEILCEMAGMRFECGVSFSSMLESHLPSIRDAELYILTPYMLPEYDAKVKAYKRRNNNVVIFNIGK